MNKPSLSIRVTVLCLTIILAPAFPLHAGKPQPPAKEDHHHATVTQVVGGLHSPRQLTFGPGDRLFVAEAGDETAGGSVIEIKDAKSHNPKVRTIISGQPTVGADGEFLGIDGVATSGDGDHFALYSLIGLSPHEVSEPFGRLLRIDRNNNVQQLVNVGSFDFDWTGAHQSFAPHDFPDANPYSLLTVRNHLYVIDAGANTLDEVMPDGTIRILAFFPNEASSDAVPTCACEGPDGALYVGTLALVDSVLTGPSAKVYRVDPSQANLAQPWTTPMTVWASGLYPINGCAFGHDDDLYVSQLFTNPTHDFDAVFSNPHGDVARISFKDPSVHTFLTNGLLSLAGGVAVHGDSVFVAVGTAHVQAGTGRIVRIDDHK